jgi:hypothetical protein
MVTMGFFSHPPSHAGGGLPQGRPMFDARWSALSYGAGMPAALRKAVQCSILSCAEPWYFNACTEAGDLYDTVFT